MFKVAFNLNLPSGMSEKLLEAQKKEIRPQIENALFKATEVIKQNYSTKVKSLFGSKRGDRFNKMVTLPLRDKIKPRSSTKEVDTYVISPNISAARAGFGKEWDGIWHMHEFGETRAGDKIIKPKSGTLIVYPVHAKAKNKSPRDFQGFWRPSKKGGNRKLMLFIESSKAANLTKLGFPSQKRDPKKVDARGFDIKKPRKSKRATKVQKRAAPRLQMRKDRSMDWGEILFVGVPSQRVSRITGRRPGAIGPYEQSLAVARRQFTGILKKELKGTSIKVG